MAAGYRDPREHRTRGWGAMVTWLYERAWNSSRFTANGKNRMKNRRYLLALLAIQAALLGVGSEPHAVSAAADQSDRKATLELPQKPCPNVFWASEPIEPDETAIVIGDGFRPDQAVEVIRVEDTAPSPPSERPPAIMGATDDSQPLQSNSRCVKFVIPKSMGAGLYVCRLATESGPAVVLLNRPRPIWLCGDSGPEANPTGSLRLFGRCLAKPGRQSTLFLRGPREVALKPDEATCWSLSARLPADLPAGQYRVWVHNGCGGSAGWSEPLELVVQESPPWPAAVYNVRDFGAKGDGSQDDSLFVQAALAKAQADGGGVVFFPRGRYLVSTTLEIPPRTVLRGEGRELAAISSAGPSQTARVPRSWPEELRRRGSDLLRQQLCPFPGQRSGRSRGG